MRRKSLNRSRINPEIEQLKALLESASANYQSLYNSKIEQVSKLTCKIELLEKALDQANSQLRDHVTTERRLAMAQGQIAGMREVLGQIDHVKMTEPSKIPPRNFGNAAGELRHGIATARPMTAEELRRRDGGF